MWGLTANPSCEFSHYLREPITVGGGGGEQIKLESKKRSQVDSLSLWWKRIWLAGGGMEVSCG